MDPVRLELRGPVAVLTLDRPKALNALNRETLEGLIARCDEVARTADVRALVLTGEGRAFAAGADIAEMRGHSPAESFAFSELGHRAACSPMHQKCAPTWVSSSGAYAFSKKASIDCGTSEYPCGAPSQL